MNARISWSPYNPNPGDVDEIYLFKVDSSLTSEKAIEDELQAHGATSTLLTTKINTTDITAVNEYTDEGLTAGFHTYCLAAKNSVGWNVGADEASTTTFTGTGVSGAIARIEIT